MKEYFNKLYKGSKNDFYDLVKKNLISNKRMFVVTANPETLMTAENNSNFRNTLLDSNTTIIADGIGIVKGAKMLGYTLPGTIPGVDVCSELFKYCNELNKSIFLFGAKKEIVKKLVDTIKQKYPNAIIAGYENGYKKDCYKVKNSFYSSSLSPAGACSRDNQCETGHLRYGRNRTPPRTGDFLIIKL